MSFSSVGVAPTSTRHSQIMRPKLGLGLLSTLTVAAVLLLTFYSVPAAGQINSAKGYPARPNNLLKGYLTRNLYTRRPDGENVFVADFVSSSNKTYFAGQEIRMRVSTALFNTEQFRNIRSSLFNRNTPHNSQVDLGTKKNLKWNYTMGNYSWFPGFNISGPSPVRIRVIPAYSSRGAMSGQPVSCRDQTDVWAEMWGMSARTLAWGKSIAYSAYATFTVPPFKWKVCVKDITRRNYTRAGDILDNGLQSGWREFDNLPGVQDFVEPLYMWHAPQTHYTGDDATFKLVVNGRRAFHTWNGKTFDPFDFSMTGSIAGRGDQVKVVPEGFPCTYEKASATADLTQNAQDRLKLTTKQYCGSNYVARGSGDIVTSACVAEGTHADGVGRVGSETNNPWATYDLDRVTSGQVVPSGVHAVFFIRLPLTAGRYDICYSPTAYRRSLLNVTILPLSEPLVNPVPLWFKVYKATGTCPTTNQESFAACGTRTTAVDVVDDLGGTAHGMKFDFYDSNAGSWGSVKISGTGLSTGQATLWEYSSPRSMFTTAGGDQFRLVPVEQFQRGSMMRFGDLYQRPDGTRLTMNLQTRDVPVSFQVMNRVDSTVTSSSTDLSTAGTHNFRQVFFGDPAIGSIQNTAGCFFTGNDNYGNPSVGANGNPGTQCCTSSDGVQCVTAGCSLSEVDDRGVTASANLGSSPRTLYNGWLMDQTGLASTYAYVRFPFTGTYRVCYRKAGTDNWRSLTNAVTGSFALRPLANPIINNITYRLNDTTQLSHAAIAVTSPYLPLTYVDHNILDTTISDATVIGSSLKIVKNGFSCDTTPGEWMASSSRPGSLECDISQCPPNTVCSGCEGPANDQSGNRRTVYHYVRLPQAILNTDTYYRVCFRTNMYNWIILKQVGLRRQLYRTDSAKFNTVEGGVTTYGSIGWTLSDRRAGTWAQLIIRRPTGSIASPLLSSFPSPVGDAVRLVPNTTSRGQTVMCNVAWNVSSTQVEVLSLQAFNASFADADLGSWCSSSSTTDACTAAKLTPTNGAGQQGNYPYLRIDSVGDQSNVPNSDGVVAFLTIPDSKAASGGPAGFRVCYKPRGLNWIEIGQSANSPVRVLQPTRRPNVTLSVAHHPVIYAGMYGYVQLTAGSSLDQIDRRWDLFKLVPGAQTCDRPPAGDLSFNNRFQAQSGMYNARGGSVLVDGSSESAAMSGSQANNLMIARAYMTFPTFNSTTATIQSYRACYMKRGGTGDLTMNWQDIGTINVTSIGVTFTVQTQPVAGGLLDLNIKATTFPWTLNTTLGGDRVKVVLETDPCGAGTFPNGVSSLHQDQRLRELLIANNGLPAANASALTDNQVREYGFGNLGPGEDAQTSFATLRVTLPYSTIPVVYKLCYKPFNASLPWIEIEGDFPSAHGFLETYARRYYEQGIFLFSVPSGITSFTIDPSIRGQYPNITAQQNYAGTIAYSSAVLSGVYTGPNKFFYTAAAPVVPNAGDTIKLVPYAPESSLGGWNLIAGVTCGDAGTVVTTVTVSGSNGQIVINTPHTPARYLVCLLRSGNSTWLQLTSSDTSTYANPFYLISTRLFFRIDLVNSIFTVQDRWVSGTTAQGSLAFNDTVYIINSNGVCGVDNSFNGQTVAQASTRLSGTPNNTVLALRRSPTVSYLTPSTFVTYNQWYKVCLIKTNGTRTTSSTANLMPFVPAGVYELINLETSTGGGTQYYSVAVPAQVVLTGCPSTTQNPGKSFEVTATIQTASGTAVPFAYRTYAYLLSLVNRNDFVMSNTLGQCDAGVASLYGWDSSNLRQYTTTGSIKFTVTPLSACPSGGCTFRVESPGLTASSDCTFQIASSTSPTSGSWASTARRCVMGQPCLWESAYLQTDLFAAYTRSDTAFITATNLTNLVLSVNGVNLTEGTSIAVGMLRQSRFRCNFSLFVTQPLLQLIDPVIPFQLTVGNVSLSGNISFAIPLLVGMYITDLFISPDSATPVLSNNETNFIRTYLTTSWEPRGASIHSGAFDVVNGSTQLVAAPGYQLLAQQFYSLVIRPVISIDGKRFFANNLNLVPLAQRNVTLNLVSLGNESTIVNNALLAWTPSCATDESCATPLPATTLSETRHVITFRLKNALGCGKQFGGCRLQLKFGGVDLANTSTFVDTPVRSVASKLVAYCTSNMNVNATANSTSNSTNSSSSVVATTGRCLPSTVNRGWTIRVVAQDIWGGTDQFFAGNILPMYNSFYNDIARFTTVQQILARNLSHTQGMIRAVDGVATFTNVTLSSICTDDEQCALSFVSDWGTETTSVGNLVTVQNTEKLSCVVETPLISCAMDPTNGNCTAISGVHSFDYVNRSNNRKALLYQDTPLCVTIQATTKLGEPTLYDTVWIHYQLTGTSEPVSSYNYGESRGDLTRRYQPLEAGFVRFCYSIGASSTASTTNILAFSVKFSSQQFGGAHWTKGLTGECTLGEFALQRKKHIGSLQVTSITTPHPNGIVNTRPFPTPFASLVTQLSPTDQMALQVGFHVFDHYGNVATADQLHQGLLGMNIVIDNCTTVGLSSSCASGDLGYNSGQPSVYSPYDPHSMGAVVIGVPVTPNSYLSSDNRGYILLLSKYCIGCRIAFNVKYTDDTNYTTLDPLRNATTTVTATAIIEFNVFMKNDAAVKRIVGFRGMTSPLRNWKRLSTRTMDTDPVLFINQTCITDSTAQCNPYNRQFLTAECSDDAVTALTSNLAGEPLQLVVALAESGATLNQFLEVACANDNCENSNNVRMQVDMMNTYTIDVSVGASQILRCIGNSKCIDDMTTAPKQIITPYGRNFLDAVRNFQNNPQVRTANFTLAGVYPSSPYDTATFTTFGNLYPLTTVPDRGGGFGSTATSSSTALPITSMSTSSSVFGLYWKGGSIPEKMAFQIISGDAPCPATLAASCLTAPIHPQMLDPTIVGDYEAIGVADQSYTSGSCPYTGYQRPRPIRHLQFNTSQPVPVGVPFPISVDVQGADGVRSHGAEGTMSLEIAAWEGCNNGGTLTVSSTSVVNGRLTAYVSFSQPCQRCILRATLTPASYQPDLYARMLVNPASLEVLSQPITVVPQQPLATHVVVTSDPTTVPSQLTVADQITLTFKTVSSFRNMQVDSPVLANVAIYNGIQSTVFDHWWNGNGHVLRQNKSAPIVSKHWVNTTFVGNGTLSFMFTKTCNLGCRVVVYYEIPSTRSRGFFFVQNKDGLDFRVRTQASQYLLAGARPRTVYMETEFPLTVWLTGSELANEPVNPILVAGVGNGSLSDTEAVVSNRVMDTTTRDGGSLTDNVVRFPQVEVHMASFTKPCRKCRLTVGQTTQVDVVVSAVATNLSITSSKWTGSYPGDQMISLNVAAVDALGYEDELFGGPATCLNQLPFACQTSNTVAFSWASSGVTMPGYSSQKPLETVTNPVTIVGQLRGGQGQFNVSFPSPVRLTNAVVNVTDQFGNWIAGSSASGIQVLASSPTPAASIASAGSTFAFVPTSVSVALVQTISGLSGQFIAGGASNGFTLSYDNCPTRLSEPSITSVTAGLAKLDIIFSNPASSDPCKISVTFDGSGTGCDPCTASTTITVNKVQPSQWTWSRPTVWDNGGLPAKPLYGAVGRTLTLEVAVLGTAGATTISTPVCDDPSTSDVESCTFSVTSNCDASVASSSSFDSRGRSKLTITFQDKGDATYSCGLTVQVQRAGSDLSPVFGAATSATISVCKPKKLGFVSNYTRGAGGFVYTARPYPLHVASLTASGDICFGDSGVDGTMVSIQAVLASDRSPITSLVNLVVNMNGTTSTSLPPRGLPAPAIVDYNAPAADPAQPVEQYFRARLVGGTFLLSLVFTQGTVANGITSGIKVKLSSSLGTLYAPAVDVLVFATALYVNPPLPQYAVVGETLYYPRGEAVVVEARDELPQALVDLSIVTSSNVATLPTEFGSTSFMYWSIFPSPSVFPIAFARATQEATLIAGRFSFAGWKWTGDLGTYDVSVRSNSLRSSFQQKMTIQRRTGIAFRTSTTRTCISSSCQLPSDGPFTTGSDGLPLVAEFTNITLTIDLRDANDALVLGDQVSVIQMNLTGATNRTSFVDDVTGRDGFIKFARAINGTATFVFQVAGPTPTGSTVQLSFGCPERRPAQLLTRGDPNSLNPCRGLNFVATAQFRVSGNQAGSQVYNSPAVLAKTPIIKGRSYINSLTGFNITDLGVYLSTALNTAGFKYIEPTNGEKVIVILSCEVDRPNFPNSDLGGAVCKDIAASSVPSCSLTANVSCPNGVKRCRCPKYNAARRMLWSRYLLAANTDIQLEISFEPWKAKYFYYLTEQDVADQLTRLGAAVLNILKTDLYLNDTFAFETSSLQIRTAAQPLVTAPPPPTPIPTTRAPPPPNTTMVPKPSGAPPAHTAALWAISVAITVLLGLRWQSSS